MSACSVPTRMRVRGHGALSYAWRDGSRGDADEGRVLIVMIMMVFAMPAYAQRMGGGKQHGAKADQAQSKEQQEKKHAAEQGYKDACCDRHSQSGE